MAKNNNNKQILWGDYRSATTIMPAIMHYKNIHMHLKAKRNGYFSYWCGKRIWEDHQWVIIMSHDITNNIPHPHPSTLPPRPDNLPPTYIGSLITSPSTDNHLSISISILLHYRNRLIPTLPPH